MPVEEIVELPSHHGAFFFSWTLPYPWPPEYPEVFTQDLGTAELEVHLGNEEGRLYATLWERTGPTERVAIAEGKTRRLLAGGGEIVVIGIRVQRGKLEFFFDDGIINDHSVSDDRPVAVKIYPTGNGVDFTDKNRKRIERRRGTFKKLIEKNDKDARNHLFVSLAEEAQLLKSNLDALERGELFQIRGISARLRLLLVREGQTPLLQACAALKNLPLIVYCFANPDAVFVPDKFIDATVSAVRVDSVRPHEMPPYTNPVDLDIWLGFGAMRLQKTVLTNHELISQIGNTIGSHLDPDQLPSVITLRRSRHETRDMTLDQLQSYLKSVASAVQPVCEFVAHFDETGGKADFLG